MEITIFMGNGFDLGAGLKTSYSDFRTHLLAPTKTHPDCPGVRLIVESIRKNTPSRWHKDSMWSDFELGLGEYASYFTPSKFKRLMSSIGKDSKKYRPIDVYWKGVKYVLKELSNYLERISDTCTKQLSSFGLQEFASWIVDPAKYITNGEKKDIQHFCYSHSNEQWSVNFWSLNYTALLEQCISNLSAAHSAATPLLTSPYNNAGFLLNSSVQYLHGDCEHQVCGVGNRKQIRNSHFRIRKKMQRLIKKHLVQPKRTGSYSYKTVRSSISSSDFIYIYGTSLGKSDIWLWRQICKWLRYSKEHHLFIYVYTKTPVYSAEELFELKVNQCDALCKGGVRIYEEDIDRIHLIPFHGNKIVHDAWFVDINTP